MLKNLKIKNLRAIKDLELDNFGRINLFVGPNGCGKTTLLESIFFLCGATNPNLLVNTNIFRGLKFVADDLWRTYFHNMDISDSIEIETTTGDKITHQLNIVPKNGKTEINLKEIGNVVSTSSDSFIPRKYDSKNISGIELLYSCSNEPDKLHVSNIQRVKESMKTNGHVEPPIPAIFVSPAGGTDWKSGFGSVQRKKRIPEVIELLKEIEPRIENIALNEIGILEVDLGLPYLIPASLMGGGVAKFLTIALAMLNFNTVLVDEIENGLHHSSQGKLWRAIFSWAQKLNVQVFATTHSWEGITAFHEASKNNLFGIDSKLFRIERDEDRFKCVEFSQNELETSLNNQWEVR